MEEQPVRAHAFFAANGVPFAAPRPLKVFHKKQPPGTLRFASNRFDTLYARGDLCRSGHVQKYERALASGLPLST